MNLRALLLALPLALCTVALSSAKRPPVSPNPRLAEILRLAELRPADWQALVSIAESGDPEAQYRLGVIYDQGRLLAADKEKSDLWLQKAAAQGHSEAEYSLCLKRADADSIESERCMWRAAENGVAGAQFWLGVAFEQHLWFGVTDDKEALKWFRRAAESGDPDAEATLGSRYESGEGLEQDYQKAAYWYRRAAEHVPNLGGAGQGRGHLGMLYMDGNGVPKDLVQADVWSILAGFDRNTDSVERMLNPQQITVAHQLAADWKKKHPDPAIY